MFNIADQLSPEEEAQVREENRWAQQPESQILSLASTMLVMHMSIVADGAFFFVDVVEQLSSYKAINNCITFNVRKMSEVAKNKPILQS